MTINENVVLTTVVTYDEWLLHAEEIKSRMGSRPDVILDVPATENIKDHPKIVGFMTQPVALYDNDKVIEAKTMKLSNISTLPDVLASLPTDIVMYGILCQPGKLTHGVMDPMTFKVILADTPKMSPDFWYIRYAEVNR